MLPAGDDPQTRTALDAYQAAALRWLGGGVIAVVLGILLGTAVAAMAGESGRRVPVAGLVVLVLVFVGLVAIAAGTGALLRAVRWRRALATASWQTGTLRVAGPSIMAFEPDGYDELDPADARGLAAYPQRRTAERVAGGPARRRSPGAL